ncbi:MAG TPA: hypothetical protein VE954_39525 [Oligoflexus sp.]|uniref:hypothetical protein n=1 Tax=Oligoflexus sp. TaxID=1971216 RepID=UPI002D3E5D48|nr:hypothetical protein [Oligoflexus sp.]HYX39232.1 hypothetical protein [Oligoflexus sp.]
MKYTAVIMLGALSSIVHAEGLLPCQLKADKRLIYNPYTACVSGHVEVSERALGDNDQTRADTAVLAQMYGSVGLGHWVSLHARGAYTRQAGTEYVESRDYKRTEQLFLQMGHPVVDPFYASVGRLDAPFGLNHDVFRLSLPSRARRLWLTSVNGGRIGVGSREGYRLEVGTSNLVQPNPLTGEERSVLSGRIVRTIDLLEGARIMASYASSSDYTQRRMGLATLVHHDENRTSLEWIRVTEATLPDYFDQVFRLVHEQQLKRWSWVLAMEELRKDSYRLSYGVKRPWIYNLIGTMSVHYQRERAEPKHHWVAMVGMGFGQAWAWEEQEP